MIATLIVISALCAIAAIIFAALYISLRKSLRELTAQYQYILSDSTNKLISAECHNRYITKLTDTINEQLKSLREKELLYINGDRELKAAITGVAHDLRTPLTAICGYIDLLETESISSDARRYADIIRQRADGMKRLTEELFNYSIITDSQLNSDILQVRLNSLLKECILDFYPQFTERNIMPEIDITDTPIDCIADKNNLTRIFSNIIGNAVKYSSGDFHVKMTDDGTITFSNAASELDSVDVGRLFDRFYTVENGKRSTGLGLSIARKLSERMGGKINATLSDGILTVSLSLPVRKNK